jgi:hypothetical protein
MGLRNEGIASATRASSASSVPLCFQRSWFVLLRVSVSPW